MKGIIIKNISNTYLVEANEKKYNCLPRGKLRLTKSTPLVGDHVIFDEKNNPLGISEDAFDDILEDEEVFLSDPQVLEYKYSLM